MNEIKIKSVLYNLIFILYLMMIYIRHPFEGSNEFFNNVRIYMGVGILLLIALFVVLFQKINIKYILIGLIFICVTILTMEPTILILYGLFLINIGYENDFIIKKYFRYNSFFIVFFIILGLFGLNSDSYQVASDGATRYNLGFRHPNHISMYFFGTIISYIYLNKDKKINKSIFISLILTFILYRFTRTRALIALFTGLILLFFRKYVYNIMFNFKFVMLFIIPIFTIISYYLAMNFYDSAINNLSSNRLFLWKEAISISKISLTGVRGFTELIPFAIDNAYLNILFSSGLLMVLLISVIYYFTCKRLFKNKDKVGIIIILTCILYLFFEMFLYSPANFSLFIIIILFSSKGDEVNG